ncbi:chemotaxis response regulator protein-glutamate methylesterase [Salipiger pacificus]|nr:chemotaxis response regulator protein-glutamate methylesterase [Alloyangia pacifica]MCA0943334.1 chemotaxis response regulator protein-glutamate methylesterase [Alloyangia pacifica]
MTRPNAPVRVLIVDDSAAARAAFRRLLEDDPGIVVHGVAGDPFEAAKLMRAQLPDVMLLDLQLPRMDGLTFLRKVMAQHPLPVVICSSFTEKGSRKAMEALQCGASEVIGKPSLVTAEQRSEAQIQLCDAVHAAASARSGRKGVAKAQQEPLRPGPKLTADVILPPRPASPDVGPPKGHIIALGASTGGTEALAAVLEKLPADMPPIIVVQHMPEHFTRSFAERLDTLCDLDVSEARAGDRPERGRVLIAPGNRHMLLRRNGGGYRLDLLEGAYVSRHRPSVDVLFRSVAQAAGNKALGLIMTGMGDDGAQGLLEMRQAGAETFGQDEATSVVFGMPKEAMAKGAVDRLLPLGRISSTLVNWANLRRSGPLGGPKSR